MFHDSWNIHLGPSLAANPRWRYQRSPSKFEHVFDHLLVRFSCRHHRDPGEEFRCTSVRRRTDRFEASRLTEGSAVDAKIGDACRPGEVGFSAEGEVLVCRGGRWARPGDVQPGGRGAAPNRRQLDKAIQTARSKKLRRAARSTAPDIAAEHPHESDETSDMTRRQPHDPPQVHDDNE